MIKKANANFLEENQYQIRGMLVLENHQKKGFGKVLILHYENQCKNQNVDLIWFNARIVAIGFYEKMGCQKIGFPFEIQDVGMRILMFKKI